MGRGVPAGRLASRPLPSGRFFFYCSARATTRALERIVFFRQVRHERWCGQMMLLVTSLSPCVLVATTSMRMADFRLILECPMVSYGVLWASEKMINPQPPCALLCSVVAVAVARLLGLRSLNSNRSRASVVIVFICFRWMRRRCVQKRALSGPGSAEKDKKQKKILGMGRYVLESTRWICMFGINTAGCVVSNPAPSRFSLSLSRSYMRHVMRERVTWAMSRKGMGLLVGDGEIIMPTVHLFIVARSVPPFVALFSSYRTRQQYAPDL